MSPVNYYSFRTEWNKELTGWARAWPGKGNMIPYHMRVERIQDLSYQLYKLGYEINQSGKRLPMSMNALARILASIDRTISMRMSAGPVDPRAANPKFAWKIPVRRITGHYFQGWYLRRLAPGVWAVYNPTREAYYIEYGIHTSSRRVRRPIRKLALLRTVGYAKVNNVDHMVWELMFGPLRPGGRRFIGTAVQSPSVMPHI